MPTIFEKLAAMGEVTTKLFPVFLVVALLLLAITYLQQGKGTKQLKYALTKGTAKGIVFGKKFGLRIYSPAANEGHCSVFGGSGLGKTSALLIPTLRAWPGSSFTIDISGDISSNVDAPNKLIYEPANGASTPYNIFASIDAMDDRDDQDEALEQLALLIMPDLANSNSDAAEFYNREGRKILTAALIAFYHLGMDFVEICHTILSLSYRDLFRRIDSSGDNKAILFINGFAGSNEQNTSGCKQSCDASIKLFATNERIRKNLRRPAVNEKSFTPAEIANHNVFVIIPDEKLKLYAPLLHIIVAQSLDFFSCRPLTDRTPILFCLDEFSSFGKLELTEALRKLRKRHIRILVLTQSLADIDLIYGVAERRAMMNNFRFKVVLGADDSDTQEYFAKLIGKREVTKKSYTSGGKGTSKTTSQASEWAVEPAELAHLGKSLILLHPNGFTTLRKNFYFK